MLATPLLAATASAAGDPPWEPDAGNAVGTLTFYDASGNVITGGDNVSHLFDYVLASTNDPDGPSTKANLLFANPQSGQPTGNWPVHADVTSSYPNASAPAPLKSATAPLGTMGTLGANLLSAESGFTANTATGYKNVFQLRLYTSGGTGGGTTSSQYWDADVQVSGTGASATWVEIYPNAGAAPTATTTTLAVTPATSAKQGAAVTVTATETGADTTHPAGTIEIDNGNQVLGSGTVDASGKFSVTKSNLLPGHQSFKATFTPTAAGYSGSTSSTKSYLINPVAKKPTISGTAQAGKKVTCKATLTSGETATYVWKASGKKVGGAKTLTVPGSAVGKSLTCTVTVKVSGGTPSSATSASKKVAKGAALKATKKPTLSGPHKTGKTEKVAHGTWSPGASSYSYQWLANGKPIKGATKSSLTLPSSLKGKTLSCRVTAHKTGFANGKATTKGVKVS